MSHPVSKATRRLKIYNKASMRNGRLLQSSQYIYLPEIRLHGGWIEGLGFHRGDRVEVACEEGRIVITPIGCQ